MTVWDVKDSEDLLEMVGEIRGFIEGLFPAQAELGGFTIGLLATSAISGLSTSQGCVLKARLSPPRGRKGLLAVIVPEGLLEHLRAGVEDVVILLDGRPAEFACAYVGEKASFVLGIAYGPGGHEVIVHLRGALDDDGDGLENYEELLAGTDPLRPDTDGDLWPDARDPWPKNPAMPDSIIIGPLAAALSFAIRPIETMRTPEFTVPVSTGTLSTSSMSSFSSGLMSGWARTPLFVALASEPT